VSEYNLPEQCRYTRDDEWVLDTGEDRYLVGITDYARQQLGDIVFVELPEIGARLRAGDSFGVIESVKAVSDLYAPISGQVVEINPELADRPESVNESCYTEGWMLSVNPSDASDFEGLLDADGYRRHVDERSE
jgi:glycine cleavage system H protein